MVGVQHGVVRGETEGRRNDNSGNQDTVTIELRVLSGTRAGAREHFETSIVTVGRDATSDLRFDPQTELDVSTRHAELRSANGVWTIHDQGSTNGTFVNGERVDDSRRLNDGDVVSIGANGPRVEVRGIADAALKAAPPATALRPSVPLPSVSASGKPRMDTSMRVAVAVEEQTRSLRRNFMLAGGALVAAGVIGFVLWQRQVSAREKELVAMFATAESTMVALQQSAATRRPGDSLYASALKDTIEARKRDLAKAREMIANGTATTGAVQQLSNRLNRAADMQESISAVSKVYELNDAAVAMLASDFDGKFLAGTAFGITRGGLLITNKHTVQTEDGAPAQRMMVIYANTKKWLRAKVVRVSDTDDLALIQVEDAGTYPIVAGVSRAGTTANVGAPVASIGYPGATDTPMEGSGMNITARTTSTPGTVSKRLDDVIQIDSYAGHGSSGSPLFDSAGNVVGVIWGGAKESNGRIVYAVPAQRLSAFIGAEGASILK
ncbi:MAG: trypsin-like peptidase domain-containing protein [bacterium]